MAGLTVRKPPEPEPAPGGQLTSSQHLLGQRTVRVNLLPPEVHEAQVLRRWQLGAGAAVVAAAAVVGLLTVQAHSQLASAQDAQASAETEHARLTAQRDSLGNVDALYTQVDRATAMRNGILTTKVSWSRVLNDVSLRLPDHVWFDAMAFTEAAPAASGTATGTLGAAAAAGTTPAASGAAGTPGSAPIAAAGSAATATGAQGAAATGAASTGAAARGATGAVTPVTPVAPTTGSIGTITFNGSAYVHNDVAEWLVRLAKIDGFTGVNLTSSTEKLVGQGTAPVPTVTWAISAQLSAAALAANGGSP